jgi:hypothetical protein
MYTINFLCGRANSTQFQGANYVYYQNTDGFHFVSIEKLCAAGPKAPKYLFQPANVRVQKVVDGYTPRTVNTDEVAIQSYTFPSNFDTLENINNGMYSSRVLWHDIRKKEYGNKDFDYPGMYPNFQHVEPVSAPGGGGLSYLWAGTSDFNRKPYGAFRHYPIGQPNQETFCKMWMLERISQMQQIQNVVMHCIVPGDSNRRVGDIVEIQLPSPERTVGDQLIMDKYYRGRYLVVSLKHRIVKSQYSTIMELVKDSVFTAYGGTSLGAGVINIPHAPYLPLPSIPTPSLPSVPPLPHI